MVLFVIESSYCLPIQDIDAEATCEGGSCQGFATRLSGWGKPRPEQGPGQEYRETNASCGQSGLHLAAAERSEDKQQADAEQGQRGRQAQRPSLSQ